ncbi:hypothetical protein NDU88_007732 [Pleurodeles waltl]|uniref:Uncharacterized protein n=1 Tax=Pleurodeles waltl TaxID=8319 RepID=A0AAV7VUH6_PLEWA|nr:hypothetical protein NDU88_007732 [Pleurodeles waltl]
MSGVRRPGASIFWAILGSGPISTHTGRGPRVTAHPCAGRRPPLVSERSLAPWCFNPLGRYWPLAPIGALLSRRLRVVAYLHAGLCTQRSGAWHPGASIFWGNIGPRPRSAPTSVTGCRSWLASSPAIVCVGVEPGALVLQFLGGDVGLRPQSVPIQ